jgi:hypothetical protein
MTTLPKLQIVGRYEHAPTGNGWLGRWYGPPMFPTVTDKFNWVSGVFGPRAPIWIQQTQTWTPDWHHGDDIGHYNQDWQKIPDHPYYVSDVYADGKQLQARLMQTGATASITAGITPQVGYYRPTDPPLATPLCILLHGHCKSPAPYAVGTALRPGQFLAAGDNTGMSTGDHEHFGMWVGPDPDAFYGKTNPNSTAFDYTPAGGSNRWHAVAITPHLVPVAPKPMAVWPPLAPNAAGSSAAAQIILWLEAVNPGALAGDVWITDPDHRIAALRRKAGWREHSVFFAPRGGGDVGKISGAVAKIVPEVERVSIDATVALVGVILAGGGVWVAEHQTDIELAIGPEGAAAVVAGVIAAQKIWNITIYPIYRAIKGLRKAKGA